MVGAAAWDFNSQNDSLHHVERQTFLARFMTDERVPYGISLFDMISYVAAMFLSCCCCWVWTPTDCVKLYT